MKAQPALPPNYVPSGKFDLKSKKQLLLMNLIGFVLVILSFWLFSVLIIKMRGTSALSFSFEMTSITSFFISLGLLLLVIFLVLLVHELIHAFFFWLFSGQKPVIGFKGAYAYAAMPGWYFPRNQYLVIGIAPLILIDMLGILLLALLPLTSLFFVLIALVINTSGAVGDLFILIWLLTKPAEAFAHDEIETIEFFVPGKRELI